MQSKNRIIVDTVQICAEHGVEEVIIAPGSRNAPLNISFNEHGSFQCLSIPDERVAGFFALGIALEKRKPVVLCCTSGTAAINFAPAICEAYYLGVPLIVLTADRPVEWVDQGDGQTIRQAKIFQNYIKKDFQLPNDPNDSDKVWSAARMVNEALILSKTGKPGPIHLNIPLREPLYETNQGETFPKPKIIRSVIPKIHLEESDLDRLAKRWNASSKKLILCGLLPKNEALNTLISEIAKDPSVVVLTETTSNLCDPLFCDGIDRIITTFDEKDKGAFEPQLLVTIGHSFISKKIKAFLRQAPISNHWHIEEQEEIVDTFQKLTHKIPVSPESFFTAFLSKINVSGSSGFRQIWKERDDQTRNRHHAFLENAAWSDMKAFDLVLSKLPEKTHLHMGNSSPVRYVQLYPQKPSFTYFGNRGASGIDGCTSTAAGAAWATKELNVVITGDIGFFYDSNAFWHPHLSSNLRVVLIHNGGGGIFRIIPGPGTTNQLEQYFETAHDTNAVHLAKMHNLNYYEAENVRDLEEVLTSFLGPQANQRPAILQVFTPRKDNDQVLKEYFEFLKNA